MLSGMEIPTWAWSGLSFCLGLVLGHRLNLWREKRKEFNELSAQVKDWAAVSRKRELEYEPLDTKLHRAFVERLSSSRKEVFARAVKILHQEFLYIRDQGAAGYVVVRKPEDVDKALDDFRRITKLK